MLGFANNLLVILEFMTCEVFFFFLPELAPEMKALRLAI